MRPFDIAAAIAVIASLLVAQSPAPSEQKDALAGEPRQFMRFVEDDDGGLLQILVANYKSGEAKLTLFGCVHVADRQFYEGMQQRFKAYDALLYELVAEPDLRPYPDMPRGGGHWISVVQGGMGSGLALHEQFACMDYRMDNFVHADMTTTEWSEALDEAGKSELGELFSIGSGDVDRDEEAEQKPIDLVKAFRSGQGVSQLRIMMGRLLCTPEGAPKQPTVIIHGRNERCLAVLKEQVAAGKKRLGIFYGAAHLKDMEQRLLKDLGWVKTSEEWVTAWDCHHSSFPKVERGLKRKIYRARRDLSKLGDAVGDWCRTHEGQQPSFEKLRAALDGKLPGRADGKDPWGREYRLESVDGEVAVRCLGSDGKARTDDDLVRAVETL